MLLGVLAADAFARGGGGGNFGGGGGGGGLGGGGGGGGDGDGLFFLIWLCFRYPAIGVPLLIVVIVFSALSAKKGRNRYRGSVIRRGKKAKTRIFQL